MEDRLAVGANWDVWITKNESVRALTAKLLHAAPMRSPSPRRCRPDSMRWPARLISRGKRNKVVISDFEFPTNAQIWHAQEPRGARVVHVPRAADGYIPLEKFAKAIDDETLLVAITHVCFRNGAKLDIPGIVRLARAKGAMVLLDCYQAVGSHGYRCQGAGCGFRRRRHAQIPARDRGHRLSVRPGFLRQVATADEQRLVRAGGHRRDGYHRQPPGTQRPTFRGGHPAGRQLLCRGGRLEIPLGGRHSGHRKRNFALTRRCMEKLQEIGWPSITPVQDERRGATVAVPSRNSGGLAAELMKRDIVTSHRDDNIRASFHFYNNEDDIESFVAAMKDLRGSFSPR